jgi:hypothetical protein
MDNGLFLLCSVAGLILVVGSLFLLWKGRIYLDHEGKSVSSIDLPGGIKFTTQFPVLVMFLFGLVLLVYPVHYKSKYYYDANLCPDKSLHSKQFPEMVRVSSNVISSKPIDVYAVVGWQDKVQNTVVFEVPFRKDGLYRLLYSDGRGGMIPSDPFMLENLKPYVLRDIKVEGEIPDPANQQVKAIIPDKSKEANFK